MESHHKSLEISLILFGCERIPEALELSETFTTNRNNDAFLKVPD